MPKHFFLYFRSEVHLATHIACAKWHSAPRGPTITMNFIIDTLALAEAARHIIVRAAAGFPSQHFK